MTHGQHVFQHMQHVLRLMLCVSGSMWNGYILFWHGPRIQGFGRFLGGRGGRGVRELKFSTQAVILARNLKSEPVSRSNNPVGPLL